MSVQVERLPRFPIKDEPERAILSCEGCKRRKIKCDKAKPACSTCLRTAASCIYPLSSQKPGPKPGAPQRRKRRTSIDGFNQRSCPSSVSSRDPHLEDPLQCLPPIRLSNYSTISSPDIDNNASSDTALSNLLHLSHDPVPNSESHAANSKQKLGQWRGTESLCTSLQISSDVYSCLLATYFDNMTAFSLFHRPTFSTKLSEISSPVQQRALAASMFAFSAKFVDEIHQRRTSENLNTPSHEHFRKLAEESVSQALQECSDDSPPLCLLQALILTTFQQLTTGVRGRSWRAIHTCVSIAYDLRLHLLDNDASRRVSTVIESCLLEEKRRAWWVIWEFDVFASTIRKLPTAIDWTNNQTWLPIDDDLWFHNTSAISCTLHPDSSIAWKQLERTGNRSAKAWFIAINALMRGAHMIAFPHNYSNDYLSGDQIRPGFDVVQEAQSSLDVLANSLYCVSSALPRRFSYNGEFLNFSPGSSLRDDSSKFSIHVMIQLTRFMLYHLRVFNITHQQLGLANSSSPEHSTVIIPSSTLESSDKAAWNVYLAAATEIVNIIRSSSPKQVRYVNPFLSSTVWLAASAQIISRKIGFNLINHRIAKSNFDLLQINLDYYVSFWGVSSSLQQKLKVFAGRLEKTNLSSATSASTVLHRTHGPQIEAPNANITRQTAQTNSNIPARSVVGTQGITAAPRGSLPSMNMPYEPTLDAWSESQTFNFEDNLFPDLNTENMWGYGLDELLTYGGFE